jgi:hypothetical protein
VLIARSAVRGGATLAELLVALTLAAIVLGAGTGSLLRQQRTAAHLAGSASSGSQLRAATGVLSAELSMLAQGVGDLAPGEARDTSLELRGFVAAGIACNDTVGVATFAESDDSTSMLGPPPKVGDSLWWYADDAGWRGERIVATDSVAAPCALTGKSPAAARRVTIAGHDTIRVGAPLRVTRPERYDFYKSADGSWQMGLRDWQDASGRFAPPQPIAGPFLLRDSAARSGMRYFDANGLELPIGPSGANVDAIARVRVTVLGIDRSGGGARDSVRRDSVDVAVWRTGGP